MIPFRPPGVLVVDDNGSILALLEIVLRGAGFVPFLALGGREGMAVLHRHRASIDVILLDVQMPIWDGPRTLAAMHALGDETPCCFMSGNTGTYTVGHLLGLGAAAVLPKPFELDALIEQLRALVDAPVAT